MNWLFLNRFLRFSPCLLLLLSFVDDASDAYVISIIVPKIEYFTDCKFFPCNDLRITKITPPAARHLIGSIWRIRLCRKGNVSVPVLARDEIYVSLYSSNFLYKVLRDMPSFPAATDLFPLFSLRALRIISFSASEILETPSGTDACPLGLIASPPLRSSGIWSMVSIGAEPGVSSPTGLLLRGLTQLAFCGPGGCCLRDSTLGRPGSQDAASV